MKSCMVNITVVRYSINKGNVECNISSIYMYVK